MPTFLSLLYSIQENAGGAAPAAGSTGGDAGAERPAGGFQMFDMVTLLGAFLLIFYFLMWKPQAKERRNREAMLKALKKGDQVQLTCGLVGEIAALTEQDVLIRFDDKDPRRLRFRKHAIQGLVNPQPEEPAAEKPAEAAAK